MGDWITDWDLIEDDKTYLLCAINTRGDGGTYLAGSSLNMLKGWAVRRLMPRCYAALPMPEWRGLPPKEKTT